MLETVKKAVNEATERYLRADLAEKHVAKMVREFGAEVLDVDYLLDARGRVMEFLQGIWSWGGGMEGYLERL